MWQCSGCRLLCLLCLPSVMATLLLSISAQVSAAPRIPCRPGQSCASWGIMTTANPGTLQNLLLATAAVSANDLWAGGWKMDTAAIASRTASRATTRRALRPAAPPARHLRPGAVRGPKDGCGCDSYALIEHWTGSTWSVATQPDSSVPGTEILGMTAISSTDVWAVGDHYDATSGNNEGLIEHWNGTVWSAVSAGPVLQGEELIGVAGKAANDVWAVGCLVTYGLGGAPRKPNIGMVRVERRSQPEPDAGAARSFLRQRDGGERCLGGRRWRRSRWRVRWAPFIEHWDGPTGALSRSRQRSQPEESCWVWSRGAWRIRGRLASCRTPHRGRTYH